MKFHPASVGLTALLFVALFGCDQGTSSGAGPAAPPDTLHQTTKIGDSADIYEPDDDMAHAMAIQPDGKVFKRQFTANELDWFVFQADSGKFYTFKTLTDDGILLWSKDFLGPDGGKIPEWQQHGDAVACLKSGKHYLKYKVVFGGGYTISLSATDSVPNWFAAPDRYENDNSQAQASLLVAGLTADHSLPVGDEDWCAIEVLAGKTYMVNMNNYGVSSTEFELYTGEAVAIDHKYVSSLQKSRIFYQPRFDERIYARVKPEWSNSSSRYRIAVSEIATDGYEPDNGLSGAGVLPTDGTKQSRTSFFNLDWIKVALDSGIEYQFSLQHQGRGPNTLYANGTYSLAADLYSADTQSLQSGTSVRDSNTTGVFYYTSPKRQDAYLCVRSENSKDAELRYAIWAAPRPIDSFEVDDSLSLAKPVVADGQSHYHLMEPKGTDWAYFEADSGATYRIQAVSQKSNSPDLEVFNSWHNSLGTETTDYGTPNNTAWYLLVARKTERIYVKLTTPYSEKFAYDFSVTRQPLEPK